VDDTRYDAAPRRERFAVRGVDKLGECSDDPIRLGRGAGVDSALKLLLRDRMTGASRLSGRTDSVEGVVRDVYPRKLRRRTTTPRDHALPGRTYPRLTASGLEQTVPS
jgi:hypothetical protein